MQMGHDSRIIMIRVAQRQHGGLFLRFALDLGILVLDSLVADIEARSSSFFHDTGSLVERFFERLIKFLQY